MKYLIILAVLLASVFHAHAEVLTQKQIATSVATLVRETIKVTLYSLEPNDCSRFILSGFLAKKFHGYKVLGSTTISSPVQQTLLLTSLAKGIQENPGVVAGCFEPRHGLRITAKGTSFDFVICFQCLQIQSYNFRGNFLTTDSPESIFDKILLGKKIKLAKK